MEFSVKAKKLNRSAADVGRAYSQLRHAQHTVEAVMKGLMGGVDPSGTVRSGLAKSNESLQQCRKNARDMQRAIAAISELYETTERDICSGKKAHRGPDYIELVKRALIPGVLLTRPDLMVIGAMIDPDNSIGLNPVRDLMDKDISGGLKVTYDKETGKLSMDVTYDIKGPGSSHSIETLADGTVIEEIKDEGHGSFHLGLDLKDDNNRFRPTLDMNMDGYYTGYSYSETGADGSYYKVAAETMVITSAANCVLFDEHGIPDPRINMKMDADGAIFSREGMKRVKIDDGYAYVKDETKVMSFSLGGEGTYSPITGPKGTGEAGVAAISERVARGYQDANGVTREKGVTFELASIGAGTPRMVTDGNGFKISAPVPVEEGFGLSVDYSVDYGDANVFDGGKPNFDELRNVYTDELNNFDFMNIFMI